MKEPEKETLTIDGSIFDLFIYRERRNGTRGSIGKGGIRIRVPHNLSREDQFREIEKMRQWAIQKIREKKPEFKKKGWKTYMDGDLLTIGSEQYSLLLSYNEHKRSTAHAEGNMLCLRISNTMPEDVQQKHIAVLISKLITQQKRQYLEAKIRNLNKKHFQEKINKISLKFNTSTWGSCSPSDTITISTRIFFAPEDVIDYVCIHELAHLRERNHSPAFWKLVAHAMPDYHEKKRWLKENTDRCWF